MPRMGGYVLLATIVVGYAYEVWKLAHAGWRESGSVDLPAPGSARSLPLSPRGRDRRRHRP